MISFPAGFSTYQSPPVLLIPWPVAWPGSESPLPQVERPPVVGHLEGSVGPLGGTEEPGLRPRARRPGCRYRSAAAVARPGACAVAGGHSGLLVRDEHVEGEAVPGHEHGTESGYVPRLHLVGARGARGGPGMAAAPAVVVVAAVVVAEEDAFVVVVEPDELLQAANPVPRAMRTAAATRPARRRFPRMPDRLRTTSSAGSTMVDGLARPSGFVGSVGRGHRWRWGSGRSARGGEVAAVATSVSASGPVCGGVRIDRHHGDQAQAHLVG